MSTALVNFFAIGRGGKKAKKKKFQRNIFTLILARAAEAACEVAARRGEEVEFEHTKTPGTHGGVKSSREIGKSYTLCAYVQGCWRGLKSTNFYFFFHNVQKKKVV